MLGALACGHDEPEQHHSENPDRPRRGGHVRTDEREHVHHGEDEAAAAHRLHHCWRIRSCHELSLRVAEKQCAEAYQGDARRGGGLGQGFALVLAPFRHKS